MKGVILAAGKGTRLYPLTKTIPKVLLPVYDKPMIYYSLDLIKAANIEEVMIVVSDENKDIIKTQLGTGEDFNLKISYAIQDPNYKGSAGAFSVAKEFIQNDDCLLIFGDNIFLSNNLENILSKGIENLSNGYSSMFALEVDDPWRFGVLEINNDDKIISIEEKPENPKSNLISVGLYIYDKSVTDKFDKISISPRGEYEMTDINKIYIENQNIKVVKMSKDEITWFDAGTPESLLNASLAAKEIVSEEEK